MLPISLSLVFDNSKNKNTILPLPLKFQASSHLLWLYNLVCRTYGKPQRQIFSCRRSYDLSFYRQKTQKKQKPKVPESLLKKRKQNEEARARHVKSNLLAKKVTLMHQENVSHVARKPVPVLGFQTRSDTNWDVRRCERLEISGFGRSWSRENKGSDHQLYGLLRS